MGVCMGVGVGVMMMTTTVYDVRQGDGQVSMKNVSDVRGVVRRR